MVTQNLIKTKKNKNILEGTLNYLKNSEIFSGSLFEYNFHYVVISFFKPTNLEPSNPYLLETTKLKINFNIFYFLGFCNYCIGFSFFPVNTQYCCRGTVICVLFNFSFCSTLL